MKNDPSMQSKDDPYKDFARQTYKTVETNIRDALRDVHDGQPILIMVGEKHVDNKYEQRANKITPESEQEPALAAAFTEISALEAAARLVGKENMVLSVEYTPEKLPSYISLIRENHGVVPEAYRGLPLLHTLAYAVNNNIEIVASDPGADQRRGDPEAREQMQRDSVAAIATSDDAPRIVIHVGGTNHISNFSGYTNQEIQNVEGQTTRGPDPFEGIYAQTIFFNNTRYSDQFLDMYDISPNSAAISEVTYATNPVNAIQIDAPGRMSEETEQNIGEMVRHAAQRFHTQNMTVASVVPEILSPSNIN